MHTNGLYQNLCLLSKSQIGVRVNISGGANRFHGNKKEKILHLIGVDIEKDFT